MGAPTKKFLCGSALANLGTSESLLLVDSSEYNFETCKLTEFFFHEYFDGGKIQTILQELNFGLK